MQRLKASLAQIYEALQHLTRLFAFRIRLLHCCVQFNHQCMQYEGSPYVT